MLCTRRARRTLIAVTAILVAASLVVVACASFEGEEPARETADGAVADGAAADAALPDPGQGPRFCEDAAAWLCDGFDVPAVGASPDFTKWSSVERADLFARVDAAASSKPFALAARGTTQALASGAIALERTLPPGATDITCGADIRVVSITAAREAPVALSLVFGEGDTETTYVSLFAFANAYELGAYRAFVDGGETYVPRFQELDVGQSKGLVRAEVSLLRQPEGDVLVLRVASAERVRFTLPRGLVPAPPTTQRLRLGILNTRYPTSGTVEVWFDDVVCSVR